MSPIKNFSQKFISNITKHEKLTQEKRNLILSILKSTTTKREAKSYLNKYRFLNSDTINQQRFTYVNRFLSNEKPYFNTSDESIQLHPLRLAIIKIKSFNSINSKVLRGICESIKRLIKLGISPIILLDNNYQPNQNGSVNFNKLEQSLMEKSNKFMRAINDTDTELNTTIIRDIFIQENSQSELELNIPELLITPLYQGIIPILFPIIYNNEKAQNVLISPNEKLVKLSESINNYRDIMTIEKIIFIDPIGGVPSIERSKTSHVYINLIQEYDDIVSELHIGFLQPHKRDIHLTNLKSMNEVLSKLPSDVTGLITTPEVLSINSDKLNPVIYNVLTDRPIISSSLPINNKIPQLSTTILRRGIPVNIISSLDEGEGLSIIKKNKTGELNMSRLFSLINDSFKRELNVERYLKRVENSVASIIIAGDYDGAAIITYENGKNGEKVAYLDKFAVSSSNQGSTGIADVIFKVMVNQFPEEIIWRSRKNNPVNKWYFDRCKGSLSVTESDWKIFYTGSKCSKMKIEKLDDYINICETIEPSFK